MTSSAMQQIDFLMEPDRMPESGLEWMKHIRLQKS